MEILNDALTFLFKERNWVVKFLLPFGLSFLVILLSGYLSLEDNTFTNFGVNQSSPLLIILTSCVVLILLIPYILIASWQTYESIQSGIEKRETKSFFGPEFGDNIKKSLKYLTASISYGLIFTIIMIVPIVFAIVIIVSMFSPLALSSGTGTPDLAVFSVALFLICCISIFALILSFGFYLITTSGLMRMISTNNFGDAFRINENIRFLRKNLGIFAGFFLIYLSGNFLNSLISTAVGFFSGIFLFSPILFNIFFILGTYVSSAVLTYFTFFFLPRYMGRVYGEVIARK